MPQTRSLTVPAWVTDGWYANNPEKQQLAIARYYLPVTRPAERAAAQAYQPEAETFACRSCGRFAFPRPSTCYWCRSNS